MGESTGTDQLGQTDYGLTNQHNILEEIGLKDPKASFGHAIGPNELSCNQRNKSFESTPQLSETDRTYS